MPIHETKGLETSYNLNWNRNACTRHYSTLILKWRNKYQQTVYLLEPYMGCSGRWAKRKKITPLKMEKNLPIWVMTSRGPWVRKWRQFSHWPLKANGFISMSTTSNPDSKPIKQLRMCDLCENYFWEQHLWRCAVFNLFSLPAERDLLPCRDSSLSDSFVGGHQIAGEKDADAKQEKGDREAFRNHHFIVFPNLIVPSGITFFIFA